MRGPSVQQARKIRAEKGLPETKLMQMRIERGLSQQGLAEKSGVSARAIRSYEQFVRPIEKAQLQTICALCLALDCKLEDIIESEELITQLKEIK